MRRGSVRRKRKIDVKCHASEAVGHCVDCPPRPEGPPLLLTGCIWCGVWRGVEALDASTAESLVWVLRDRRLQPPMIVIVSSCLQLVPGRDQYVGLPDKRWCSLWSSC